MNILTGCAQLATSCRLSARRESQIAFRKHNLAVRSFDFPRPLQPCKRAVERFSGQSYLFRHAWPDPMTIKGRWGATGAETQPCKKTIVSAADSTYFDHSPQVHDLRGEVGAVGYCGPRMAIQ